jgi:hypothetical protein
LMVFGSNTLAGTVKLAVLSKVPVAAELIVALTVKATLPVAPKFTLTLERVDWASGS